jgi:hypothetical protein
VSETLRNGIPLDVRTEDYSFDTMPPQLTGHETRIRTPDGKVHRVILLRGTRRKKWLVDVAQLRRCQDQMFKATFGVKK